MLFVQLFTCNASIDLQSHTNGTCPCKRIDTNVLSDQVIIQVIDYNSIVVFVALENLRTGMSHSQA